MFDDLQPRPIVKWAGGKRQLLQEIKKYIPKDFNKYFEPFLGGAAVLFELEPKKFVANDTNSQLINVYNVVKSNLTELIKELIKYKNDPDFFYFLAVVGMQLGLCMLEYQQPKLRISRSMFRIGH